MKISNKFLSFILAFIIILVQIPANVLANSKAIIIKDIQIVPDNGKKVLPGEVFILKLQFKLNSTESISDTRVTVNSYNNFRLVGEESTKNLSFTSSDSNIVSYKLIYDGGGNTNLPISISYVVANETKTISNDIDIFRASNVSSENDKEDLTDKEPEVIDKDSYTPNISIVGNKTILGEAGESVRIPIKIKNTGQNRARNISASITLEDSKGVFIDGSGFDSVSRLSSGDDKNLSFRIRVDKFAEEKTYPINVKFNYYNEYDLPFSSSDTVYLRVSGDGNDHQLIIDSVNLSPEDNIIPGGNVVVGFYIRNLSVIPARDIKLSIDNLEKNGFSLAKGTNKAILKGVASKGTAFIQFPLKVSQQLKAGNHELKLNLSYKNLRGQILEDQHQFFIPIKGSSKQNSSLIIENIKSPTNIKGNSSATVSFDLRNRGQDDARDIIVTADLPDTDGLVPKSVTTIKIDNLESGEKRNLTFNFFATKEAPTKNYPINIKVEHTDDFKEGEEKYELTQFIGIFVDNPESDKDAKSSVPKLIIDKYSFSTDMVEAGKNFDMHLSFFNTNNNKSVKNIKIFLTAEPNMSDEENVSNNGSSVFTPVNSSNTFYIDSIPPKGRVKKSITMFTIPDAAAKTHTITANFEYEDDKAEEYKATELIGVPVVQQSKLEISELNYFPDVSIGEPVSISAEFYNTGKVTLYNMMVKLEGDFQTENGSYYIGNFASGTSEFFDGTVIPNASGELKGDVVFTFEDSTGEIQEERREFVLNVSDMIEDDFPDDFEMEEPKSFFQKIKLPFTLIFLFVLGFVGFKFYKKKKQEKEDKDLLDE